MLEQLINNEQITLAVPVTMQGTPSRSSATEKLYFTWLGNWKTNEARVSRHQMSNLEKLYTERYERSLRKGEENKPLIEKNAGCDSVTTKFRCHYNINRCQI
jgi:hypothetical protein